ncbi:MAG: 3-oxoacyl-(acyl-carrier-protein) synthase [Frankiales bacterium]|nr:3-oxoacyl-(acyl-carrier-protein) synthase [Frankiales bacterium]
MALNGRLKSRGSRVVAWGHYQPSTTLTNDDLIAAGFDSDDEWIRTRTGITERRVARADESLVDMAEQAARDAIAKSEVPLAEIDLVILATCTAKNPVPIASAQLADRLGIGSPGSYDVNAACAGFTYATSAASDAILCGQARNVLVVGAEKFSDWMDWRDRSTAMIFADGAGAAVLSRSEVPGVGPLVCGSDGFNAQAIRIDPETSMIAQDGQTVYRWATSSMGDVALEVCRRAGVKPDELVVFAPHQANLRIIRSIAARLGAANALVVEDIVTSGNTSAASIPMGLSKLLATHSIAAGLPMLLIGFGAGLTYAGQVVLSP